MRWRLLLAGYRIGRHADPYALDLAMRATDGRFPEYVRHDRRQYHLAFGIAWRERALRITGDVEDLDRSAASLGRIARDWPVAQVELARTLTARYARDGDRADARRAVGLVRAAATAEPGNSWVRDVEEEVMARLRELGDRVVPDGLTATGPVRSEDGRFATVWSGDHFGVRRHVVVLTGRADGAGVPPFADLWDESTWAFDVLLLLYGPGEPPAGTRLPYRMLPDGDLAALAADALATTRLPVSCRGPYRIPGTAARSLVLSGHFAGRARRVAVLTLGETPWPPDEARLLFHAELADTDEEEFCWLAHEPVPVPHHRSRPELMTRDPALLTTSEYGEAMLRFATCYEHAGLQHVWQRPLDHGHRYGVLRDPDEPVTLVDSYGPWPPYDGEIERNAETWDLQRAAYAEKYRRDMKALLRADGDDGRLIAAFEAFAFHLRMTGPADAEPTVADGLELAAALREASFPYAAEWVAAACADLARAAGLPDAERAHLRQAAIASEAMGLYDVALDYYQRALDVPGESGDPWLRRNLHLSYATTCVSLFATHEPEDTPLAPASTDLIRRALGHLDTAEGLISDVPPEETGWARLAVPAHRWRLRDLLGEHVAAEGELAALLRHPDLPGQPQLHLSVYLFHLAALRKLADADPEYRAALDGALAGAGELSHRWGGDRRIVYDVLLADRQLQRGEYLDAFLTAENAHELQSRYDDRDGRTPLPGDVHAGTAALDTLARMCRAWLLLEGTGTLSPTHLALLARVLRWRLELARSRWLRRGLVHHDPGPAGLDERLGGWGDRMRAELTGREVPASREITGDPARRLAELSGDERIAALRAGLPDGTALISFYGARDFTFVSCVTPERSLFLSLPVSRAEVRAAVEYLQTGFSGSGLYPPIDPEAPFDLPGRYVERLTALGRLLSPLVPLLRDSPLLLVAPHGDWHGIPVHALLLPELWDSGANPALSYVPGLDMAATLLARAAGRSRPRTAALATYPLAPAEEPHFRRFHGQVENTLRGTVPAVDALFGRDATPDEVLSMAGRADLVHVLAHGSSPKAARAIRDSGLVLSPGSAPDPRRTGPNAYDLLTAERLGHAGLDGTHLTLQACSVGRTVSATNDELWGPARSALLAGAGSVLAPMWSADLHSSTHLLTRFYDAWLAEGRSKNQAFTEAQRDLYHAADGPWRHLYHWAAFKMTGA